MGIYKGNERIDVCREWREAMVKGVWAMDPKISDDILPSWSTKDVIIGNLSWKDEFHEDDPLSSTGPSWSKKQHSKGSKREQPRNKRFYYRGRRPFEFCQDIDDEVENIFGSAFGGSRFFYWSFLNEDPQWRRSRYLNNYERSWSWSYRFDEDSDSSTESGNAESSDQDTIADRRALGLSASGPLTLEVVKTHIDPVH